MPRHKTQIGNGYFISNEIFLSFQSRLQHSENTSYFFPVARYSRGQLLEMRMAEPNSCLYVNERLPTKKKFRIYLLTLTIIDTLPSSLKHQPLIQEILFRPDCISQAAIGVIFLDQVLDNCCRLTSLVNSILFPMISKKRRKIAYLPKNKSIVIVIHNHRGSSIRIKLRERCFLHREHIEQDNFIFQP